MLNEKRKSIPIFDDNKWENEWENNIMSAVKLKSTEEEVEEAIENDGLAFMDDSEKTCPILQTVLSGNVIKNPNCGHHYSVEGFEHLFAGTRQTSKQCAVAGCPQKVNKNNILTVTL